MSAFMTVARIVTSGRQQLSAFVNLISVVNIWGFKPEIVGSLKQN